MESFVLYVFFHSLFFLTMVKMIFSQKTFFPQIVLMEKGCPPFTYSKQSLCLHFTKKNACPIKRKEDGIGHCNKPNSHITVFFVFRFFQAQQNTPILNLSLISASAPEIPIRSNGYITFQHSFISVFFDLGFFELSNTSQFSAKKKKKYMIIRRA